MRRPLSVIGMVVALLTVGACAQLAGLDDLTDRVGPGSSGEGSGDEPRSAPGPRCVFDTSRLDDGCVLGP
jgi:hypothetical protein